MLGRSALALVALTGAAAITPLCAQQLDSLPAQDSVVATPAQPASSSSRPMLGPRLSPQFQTVRPQLGPSSRSEGSSFMDDDAGNTTITISTVTLLLIVIIVILLVK